MNSEKWLDVWGTFIFSDWFRVQLSISAENLNLVIRGKLTEGPLHFGTHSDVCFVESNMAAFPIFGTICLFQCCVKLSTGICADVWDPGSWV